MPETLTGKLTWRLRQSWLLIVRLFGSLRTLPGSSAAFLSRTSALYGKDALQYAFFGLAVYGVALIYLPAALIFGGLVMVASLELK